MPNRLSEFSDILAVMRTCEAGPFISRLRASESLRLRFKGQNFVVISSASIKIRKIPFSSKEKPAALAQQHV